MGVCVPVAGMGAQPCGGDLGVSKEKSRLVWRAAGSWVVGRDLSKTSSVDSLQVYK